MKKITLFSCLAIVFAGLFVGCSKYSTSGPNSITDGDNVVGNYIGTMDGTDTTYLLKLQVQITKKSTSNYQVVSNIPGLPDFIMLFTSNTASTTNNYSVSDQTISGQELIGAGLNGNTDCEYYYTTNTFEFYVMNKTTGVTYIYDGTRQ